MNPFPQTIHKNNNGSIALLIASSVAIFFGLTSLYISELARIRNHYKTQKLDQMEGYFAAEMAMLFGVLKGATNEAQEFQLNNIDAPNRNRYDLVKLSGRPDAWSILQTSQPIPVPITLQSGLDSGSSVIRRYSGNNLTYRNNPSSRGGTCGAMHFPSSKQTVCISAGGRQAIDADIKVNGIDGEIIHENFVAPVTLTWTSQNASSCEINSGQYTGLSGTVETEPLMSDRSYTLTCRNEVGETATDQVSVKVIGPFVCDGLRKGYPSQISDGTGIQICPPNYAAFGMNDTNSIMIDCCPLPNETVLSHDPTEQHIERVDHCGPNEVITGIGLITTDPLTQLKYQTVLCTLIDTTQYTLSHSYVTAYWSAPNTINNSGFSGSSAMVSKSMVPAALRYGLGREYWEMLWSSSKSPAIAWDSTEWDTDGCVGYDGQFGLLITSRGDGIKNPVALENQCGHIRARRLLDKNGIAVQLLPRCTEISGNGLMGNWATTVDSNGNSVPSGRCIP